jgi:hypothetical protein
VYINPLGWTASNRMRNSTRRFAALDRPGHL